MQTNLAAFIKNTPLGQDADEILRKCVHCGFCTATCPTYLLLGDELDGPRGRIYLIKQTLEGKPVSRRTQLHLDRCLTCRSCETTCPSGVRYGRLADIGRAIIEERVKRPFFDRAQRWLLRTLLPYPKRFAPVFRCLQWIRFCFPETMKRKVPGKTESLPWPSRQHRRKMLILDGCVQPVIAPNINGSAARILDKLGITLISAKGSGCCGAISHHLSNHRESMALMKRNIDAWWPYIEQGIEAIVTTASGCGVTVKEYGELLKYDEDYAEKALRVSDAAKDIGEILAKEDLTKVVNPIRKKAVFHIPCTLQHGQQLNGTIDRMLRGLGLELADVADSHLCCGSAGVYSMLQSSISQQLLLNKISALEAGNPELIVTANIGCLLHLQRATDKPVKHWIEILDQD